MSTRHLPVIKHWIGGECEPAGSDRSEVVDPATGRPTAVVVHATEAEVDHAVTVATAASRGWGATSLSRRSGVLFAFRQLVHDHADELAKIITTEHGKTVADARGEVTRGLEVVDFACGVPHLVKGEHSSNVSTLVDSYSIRQPLGVTALITPFNFPAMVPMWFFPIAIATGNAVILKPSEKVPSAAMRLAELWAEAGLPDGVFTVLHGSAATAGALVAHPGIDSVSFVGSTPVARQVYEMATAAGKRAQALGSAKNHMVVLPDADLALTADAAVSAAYGSAGERCMAVSVLLAAHPIADDLIAAIRERIRKLHVGAGASEADMGPLISSAHRDRVHSIITEGTAGSAAARLVEDGRSLTVDGAPDGFWLGPTLFDEVPLESRLYTEEIFGPVLSVVRVADLSEALEVVNGNRYGNGAAIFTSDGGAARRFETDAKVGMIGINVPVPVPMAYYSFGGWKDSLFGDTHAHGMDGVRFFTRGKVITARWPDPAHRGVRMGFPSTN